VAIDRATPKEDTALRSSLARLAGPGQRRSFDNGAGLVGPGLTPLVNYAALQGLAAAAPFGMEQMAYGAPGRLSEEHQRGLNASMVATGLEGLGFRDTLMPPGSPSGLPGLAGIDELDKDLANRSPQPLAMAMGANGSMDSLSFAKAQAALNASAVGGFSLNGGMNGFNSGFGTLGSDTLLQTGALRGFAGMTFCAALLCCSNVDWSRVCWPAAMPAMHAASVTPLAAPYLSPPRLPQALTRHPAARHPAAMNTGLNGNSNYLRDVMGLAGAMHPLIAGAQKKLEQANRRSFDNPSIANARWAG
jgi:hypothetical protein